MKKEILAITTMAFIMAGSSAYALTTVQYNNGVLQNTSGISGYQTYSNDMVGMTIDLTMKNGDVISRVWGDIGGGVYGVSGGWGDLSFNNDSFTANWSFDTDRYQVDSIFIDAGAGNAVFDVWDDTDGTDGSALGHAFSTTRNSFDNILATYSGAVGVGGNQPVGDLFRYLNIDFYPGYFSSRDVLNFRADTDSLTYNNDIAPVPEPSTVLLMGLGLAGLVGYGRKRNKKSD